MTRPPTQGMRLVKLSDLPTDVPEGHWRVASRVIEQVEGRLIVQHCEMAADGGAEPHAHDDQDQIFLVLEGALAVSDDRGGVQEVAGGEALMIPAGVPHGTQNAADRTTAYFVLTYPAQ